MNGSTTGTVVKSSKRLRRNARVFAWVALALLVRAVLIGIYRGGGSDLRIYYYFAHLVLQGLNPYHAPADGLIAPVYADMTPLNLGLFAALLRIYDSPLTLRVFFALIDLAILLLLGFRLTRPEWERRALLLFYAFNPLILISWVAISEDKTLILLLLLLILMSLEAGRGLRSVLLTTVLAAYKWMGGLFLLPLVHHAARRRRDVFLYLGVFAVLFGAAQTPYFPDNLAAWQHRAARAAINPPIHASILQLVYTAHPYRPVLVKVLIAFSVAVIYSLYFAKRLDIRETLVLSVFFPYIVAPEIAVTRIVLITLPFLLIIRLTRLRMGVLWAVTVLGGAALLVNFDGLPFGLDRYGTLATGSRTVFGEYGSIRHVLFMNLFPAVALFYYLRDRCARKPRLEEKPANMPVQ